MSLGPNLNMDNSYCPLGEDGMLLHHGLGMLKMKEVGSVGWPLMAVKHPGDYCPLIWGVCNHAFHLHCILKWVNSQTSQAHCPICRRERQFKG